jgi:hypothetical protein
MSFTFANAKTFLRDYNKQSASDQSDRIIARIANDANFALHSFGDWDFDKKVTKLNVAALLNDGTVDIANGDNTVAQNDAASFSSSLLGRYIRINGDPAQYLLTAYVDTTHMTISPAYFADSVTAATYQITNDRVSLPTDFRDIYSAQLDMVTAPMCSVPLDQIYYRRQFYKELNYPRLYAVEWSTSVSVTTDRVPYLQIYPAAQSKQQITIFYYAWPAEVVADADLFGLPVQAEPVLREFLVAYMLKEQRDPAWKEYLGAARRLAEINLAQFRSQPDVGQKEQWSPYGDEGRSSSLGTLFYPLAPGEPRFT